MFNHLIESSSHRQEFKRRSSFFLFTTATYAFLFVITGVVSIYAYDAHLEEQNYEIMMLSPLDFAQPAATPIAEVERSRNTARDRSEIPERVIAMLSVNHPEVTRAAISVTPNQNLPLPETGPVRIGPHDAGVRYAGSGPATGAGRTVVEPSRIIVEAGDPPPVATPTPVVKKIITASRVLNSQAIFLPKPVYPIMAKQIRVQGTVNVQVLIDETGRVVSARAVSGHPLLVVEAQRAALQARFSPTMLGDRPVKVSGVITYNFVMQ
ncbi:MAG: energy transducer TonB [Pyrinomonadaceae bacterium]